MRSNSLIPATDFGRKKLNYEYLDFDRNSIPDNSNTGSSGNIYYAGTPVEAKSFALDELLNKN